MIDSLGTNSIETGLQRLTAEPTRAPPAKRRLAPSLESYAIQEGTQRGEQEPDQTTLEALSSDDTISSTHQQANAMQLSNPLLVFTYVAGSGWTSTLMTKSQCNN